MKKYHFISTNPEVTEYLGEMATWVVENSHYSDDQVFELFKRNSMQINKIFEPYPETIFHDDPAKWAELLATNWGLVHEQELEFV